MGKTEVEFTTFRAQSWTPPLLNQKFDCSQIQNLILRMRTRLNYSIRARRWNKR